MRRACFRTSNAGVGGVSPSKPELSFAFFFIHDPADFQSVMPLTSAWRVLYLKPKDSAAEPTTSCLVSDFMDMSGSHAIELAPTVAITPPKIMNIMAPMPAKKIIAIATASTTSPEAIVCFVAFAIVALRSPSRASRAGRSVSDHVFIAFANSGLCSVRLANTASTIPSAISFSSNF